MKVKSNKVKDIKDYYHKELVKTYPRQEAMSLLDIIFEDLLQITKMDIMLNPEIRISESELLKVHFACKELLKNKPVQYIVGKTNFYGLDLIVDKNVLIPRPETEELVEWVLKEIDTNTEISILDIGTGSGAIALALKSNLKTANVWACEISCGALKTAEINATNNALDIQFLEADILEKANWAKFQVFDCIVSNPPYVTQTDKSAMQSNVLDYEPHQALFVPDEDPLKFYRGILNFCVSHLKDNGQIFFEINENFGTEMEQLLREYKYNDIILRKDLFNRIRMICGTKK